MRKQHPSTATLHWLAHLMFGLLLILSTLITSPPAQARFLTPDTWDPMLPGVDINRYAYSGNDPVNGMDPTGHFMGGPGLYELMNMTPEQRTAIDPGFTGVLALGSAALFGIFAPEVAVVLAARYPAAYLAIMEVGAAEVGITAGTGATAKKAISEFRTIPSSGKPQVTNTLADGMNHALSSLQGARNYAKQVGAGNVDHIAYNKALKTIAPALEKSNAGNYRPDVAIRMKDGSFHLIEYASKSQSTGDAANLLQRKLDVAASALRKAGYKVSTDLVEYGKGGGAGAPKKPLGYCGNWQGGC